MQENNENNNKKTLILSILGVLVLVIAVVGVSFAMFSFTGTGTKENVITTGTVSVNYEETTTIALTNQYPMTDERGSAQTGEGTELKFTVSASMSGSMTINYDLALDAVTPGTSLTGEHVKFNIKKDDTYLLSTTANTGITVASRADSVGSIITEGYLLDSDTFTSNGSHTYTIKAWVADTYELPKTETNTEGDATTGPSHSATTTSESFTFKVKVVAQQA